MAGQDAQAASASRKLRIVHLCAVDFTVRQFIAPVALALEKAGHEVQCACTKGPHWEELAEMGVTMREIPIARSANPWHAAHSVWRVYRWLREERPDVLHVHTPVASMIGRLAGWLARVPVIVYTAHGFYFHDRMPKASRRRHVFLERFFGRFQDFLFCVSREDMRAAIRLGLARRKTAFHVPNGANPELFDPDRLRGERGPVRRELRIPPRALVIGIMGRLVREKGYTEFFEAARRLARAFDHLHFMVIGDTVVSEHDDAKAEIAALAESEELPGRVHFTGLRRDVPRLLAACDIFCLPSYREGMPVSILEAMLMGLPTVTTRVRGCREAIRDGDDGFLVEPRSVAELEGALCSLVEHPAWRASLGEAARRRALSHFDERETLARQVRLYETKIAEKVS